MFLPRQIRQVSRTASHTGAGCREADGESAGPTARCESGESGKSGESGESENLPTCVPGPPFRRALAGLAGAPEWAPAVQSGGGHGRPHGRTPRGASGAREVRSLDASARSRVRSSPWAARASLGDH